MLEERLTSTYSQPNYGYGALPGMPQYPTMPGLPTYAAETKSGVENFYYGNATDPSHASTAGYAHPRMNSAAYDAPPSGVTSPVYPIQGQRGSAVNEPHTAAWNNNAYPSLGSPPPPSGIMPSNHVTPAAGPQQYYAATPDQDPHTAQYSDAPYQPSPIMRRDSQYQPSAPTPGAPEPQSPEHAQTPLYSTAAPPLHQQNTGPSSQSYYYQTQQPGTVPPGYPPMATGQPGPYPDAGQQLPASHQPARPVEESLIEL